jgi:type II secretory pathway component GspD/PulD (secretin)
VYWVCALLVVQALYCNTESNDSTNISVEEPKDEDLREDQIIFGVVEGIPLTHALQALCTIVDTHLVAHITQGTTRFFTSVGTLPEIVATLCNNTILWHLKDNNLYASDQCQHKSYHVPIPSTHTHMWNEVRTTLDHVGCNYSINAVGSTVLVTGSQVQHQVVEKYIADLARYKDAQTCISVTIIKVESGRKLDGGVDWENICQAISGDLNTTTSLSSNGLEVHANNPQHAVRALCRALETHGTVRVTSNALITAANNCPAKLEIDTQLVFFAQEAVQHSTKRGDNVHHLNTMSTATTGTSLHIHPTVTDASVTLDLRFCVSSHVGDKPNPTLLRANTGHNAEVKEGSKIPIISKQVVSTTIHSERCKVDNSFTGFLVGGLTTTTSRVQRSGIPGFARFPIFGRLFGVAQHSKKYEQIYIYIQPITARPMHPKPTKRTVYKKAPLRKTRRRLDRH